MDGPCDEPTTDLEALGGLFSPGRRALTSGLVMTVTLVAFEALAVSTVMPLVATDLGGLALYGWVFSAFFLANIVGIVVAGGLIDRGGLVRPLAGRARSVLDRPDHRRPGPVDDRPRRRSHPPGARRRRHPADRLRERSVAPSRTSSGRGCSRSLSTAWVVPGLIGPALAGAVAEATSWRLVFLGLLPLIVVAAAITLPGAEPRCPTRRPARPPGRVDGDRPTTDAAAGADPWRRLRLALVLVLGAGALRRGPDQRRRSSRRLPRRPSGSPWSCPPFRRLTPVGTLRAAPGLPAAVLLRGILTFTFFCADAYVPLALQGWRGLGPAVAGLALTGATLSWTSGAWVQARMIGDWGARRLVRSGFVTVVVGIVGFAAVLAPSVPVAVGIAAWTRGRASGWA